MAATKPQDRKTKAKPETPDDTKVDVTWRSMKFTIESDPEGWDVETLQAFETGRVLTALRGILGERQWTEFTAAKPKPKGRDAGALFETIASAAGFDTDDDEDTATGN